MRVLARKLPPEGPQPVICGDVLIKTTTNRKVGFIYEISRLIKQHFKIVRFMDTLDTYCTILT